MKVLVLREEYEPSIEGIFDCEEAATRYLNAKFKDAVKRTPDVTIESYRDQYEDRASDMTDDDITELIAHANNTVEYVVQTEYGPSNYRLVPFEVRTVHHNPTEIGL